MFKINIHIFFNSNKYNLITYLFKLKMKEEKKEDNEGIVYGILKNNLKIISITKLPFIIGRKEKCDLFINNPSISKKHAIIQFDEEEEENTNIKKSKEIILIDNSLNGTYVNNTKITNGKKILLETGDKISFGNDKIIYVFELMNYDHDKTIIYPNLLSINKIEANPISLVNEDYYQKSEINHFNTIKTKNSEMINDNVSDENNKINKNEENKSNKNNLNEENKDIKSESKEKEEKIEENEKNIKNENEKINENENKIINNYYSSVEQIFSLKQEIFELKKENDTLKTEINTLKDTLEKTNNNLYNINNNINKNINNNNDISFKNNNTETSNSLNNSNINLLAEDLRELGLFRRIKEALVPNYSELNFEELSLKFDNIIVEYKNKYNIAEILLNMEKEFNNEISKFNNIISLQQEQKRDTLNKINYLLNKDNNNLENNNSYSKANKYLMEQLNDLISDKEIKIKLISQLKGDIIKLKTEINLYKANINKNLQIKNNLKNAKKNNPNIIKSEINENENELNTNNKLLSEFHMKNYIDYNIDKYSIGYNKYKKPSSDEHKENFIQQYKNDYNKINNYNNYERNYIFNGNNEDDYNEKNDDDKNSNLDDYRRLNLLVQNSEDNLKYQEIIKQKELIVNGIK